MQMTKLQDKDLEAFYGGHIPEEVRKGLTRAREYEREADCKVWII